MPHTSLLDIESGRPDDRSSSGAKASAMQELITSIEIIKSNYATREELAILSGKIDVLASNQQAFQTHAIQTFATKAELSDAVYQLTWRMAGFAVVIISAMAAFVRYLQALPAARCALIWAAILSSVSMTMPGLKGLTI
ncbi:hypothetical protein KW842_10710 [Duganella sp. sic0402]|uniref:hypothetical protein n=1 Tax=Duganella sp. sic0402 TaxID=2854786 RepID=UPI001C43DB93|nr:hypothetical protein [Duganella sp. sic0402]MBV7536236.1 hypothetical protein [Duganella sp. sic0402]